MLFASGGYQVRLFDNNPEQLSRALRDIKEQLQLLAEGGLGKGSLNPEQQYSRISPADSLEMCVCGASLVMVCVY